MRKSIITLLMILSITFVFAGCGSRTVKNVESGVSSTVDYAEDKAESLIPGSQNNGSYNNSGNTSGSVTKDEAKDIAFKHAGVKEADAHDIEAEHETDDGKSYYEVTFDTKDAKYDYHIDSTTGEILSSDKELKNNSAAQ